VAVVLSGCGVFDGSEIHEAVSVLVALDRHGAETVCLAPDVPQLHTIDHLAGKPADGPARNVLIESARIARGKIRDIAAASAEEFDALVFPGGFGAAKNLCDFAAKGPGCAVHPAVARLCQAMNAAKKPIGFACIAPVIAARLFGATVTIGNDTATAAAIEQMGGKHQTAGPTDICVDEASKIVTTPCYMYDSTPWQVFQGADRMVEAVLRLASAR
jgi:enhancing lycopene biosynthesis protein 2